MYNESSISNESMITEKPYTTDSNGRVQIHRKKTEIESNQKLIHISQSKISKEKESNVFKENSDEISFNVLAEDTLTNNSSETYYDEDYKPKKKKKQNKKKKKNKKKQSKFHNKKVKSYSDKLETSNRQYNSGQLLSGILANSMNLRIVGKTVYMYDDDKGYFQLSDKQV